MTLEVLLPQLNSLALDPGDWDPGWGREARINEQGLLTENLSVHSNCGMDSANALGRSPTSMSSSWYAAGGRGLSPTAGRRRRLQVLVWPPAWPPQQPCLPPSGQTLAILCRSCLAQGGQVSSLKHSLSVV